MRVALIVTVVAAAVLVAAACSPLPVLNALVPSSTYTAAGNIAYLPGGDPRHQLDIYMPSPRPAGVVPVVVFFYGGNWDSGKRADYRFAGEAFASQGFVAVVADYRLYPEVKYPDFLADCAAAFAWTQVNIGRYGGDPARMFLAGHSSGAYNAAMLAFAPSYLKAAGSEVSAVKGLIGLAGPYDFLPLTGATPQAVFGYPDTSPLTQPINHVANAPGARLPPTLLLTAPGDTVVLPRNSEHLAARLRAAGGLVQEVSYPGLDHPRMVGALAAPLRQYLGPVLDDIAKFIRARP